MSEGHQKDPLGSQSRQRQLQAGNLQRFCTRSNAKPFIFLRASHLLRKIIESATTKPRVLRANPAL